LGKSVHPNRPGKKRISGFGLPPIAVTKIKHKKYIYSNIILEAHLDYNIPQTTPRSSGAATIKVPPYPPLKFAYKNINERRSYFVLISR